MAEEKDANKCGRATCTCPPSKGSKYCCEDCENTAQVHVMEIACSCHHAECK